MSKIPFYCGFNVQLSSTAHFLKAAAMEVGMAIHLHRSKCQVCRTRLVRCSSEVYLMAWYWPE